MHEYKMKKYVDLTQKNISLIGTIVSRGHWLGNPANTKVENIYGAVVYVGSSLTVHNPLFSVHKLWLNKLMRCFYWSITSKWWECYWTLCTDRSKKANKHLTNNKGFPNHSILINYVGTKPFNTHKNVTFNSITQSKKQIYRFSQG